MSVAPGPTPPLHKGSRTHPGPQTQGQSHTAAATRPGHSAPIPALSRPGCPVLGMPLEFFAPPDTGDIACFSRLREDEGIIRTVLGG